MFCMSWKELEPRALRRVLAPTRSLTRPRQPALHRRVSLLDRHDDRNPSSPTPGLAALLKSRLQNADLDTRSSLAQDVRNLELVERGYVMAALALAHLDRLQHPHGRRHRVDRIRRVRLSPLPASRFRCRLNIPRRAGSRYQFYTTFTMWPPEVRADLRAGIKAKHQGDLDLSERYLRRYVLLPTLARTPRWLKARAKSVEDRADPPALRVRI